MIVCRGKLPSAKSGFSRRLFSEGKTHGLGKEHAEIYIKKIIYFRIHSVWRVVDYLFARQNDAE
jgi:hypothetical protein